MADPKASGAFDQVAPEVTRFFDSKGLKESFHWQDLPFDEHAHAFTVAKSTGYNVLEDIRDAVSKAIHDRQDFEDFRRELEPILRAKGWWGEKQEIDPLTHKPVKVQLGSARRLKTIYWANVNSAYAAGEWEKIQRTKLDLPFLEYLISTAVHKRLEHLEWVGTILPVDDEWWDEHYPPSAWMCQCRVRQLSPEQARERGYDPENPARPINFGRRTFTNKRTGEVSEVPVGVDPGWAQNAGQLRQKAAADFLAGKIEAMSETQRRAAVADLANSWLARLLRDGKVPFDPASHDPANVERGRIAVAIAALPDDVAKEIGAATHVVQYSAADAATGKLPKDLAMVQQLIDQGGVVSDGAGGLVAQGALDGENFRASFRLDASGAVYLTTFEKTSGD